ncbi:FixH family protein [bacterium]|nr:FixH family protein [bacterium]
MKLNWGIGIAILYSGFALSMIGFLIFSRFQTVELVAPNYYDNEVRYQQHIDMVKRTQALSEPLRWELKNKSVLLQFPSSMKHQVISGSVTFYRPSNSNGDYVVPIKVDAAAAQSISIDRLFKGLWKMQIRWAADSATYYNEEILTLQ